ncbi:MAG TPA: ATP-binding protein [bacterium]|nr:ATP-binding protein [bacterium]
MWEDFAQKLFDGRYEFLSLLGKGSWSEVVRAFDRTRSSEVAVKLLMDRAGDDVLADRFSRSEFRAMANIDHPNVVRVLDFGQSPEGIRYYTMEIVPGEALSEYVGELRGRRFENVFEGLCRALWAVHTKGCLHCDVKPDNVMLVSKQRKYEPVLMDFGLSIDLSAGSKASPRGTPLYAAPEMLAGLEVDARADIYSLGMTLLEVLTGKLPFEGLSLSSILSAKGSNEMTRESLARVPKRYRDSIAMMTAPDPRDRFPSCLAVLNTMAAKSSRDTDLPSPPPVQRHLLRPDLIGRTKELEAITRSVDDLEKNKGGCILIQGARGTGKTRLLEEARYYAQLSGARVVATTDHPGSTRGPSLFSTLRSAVNLKEPNEESRNHYEMLVRQIRTLSRERPLVLLIDDIHKLETNDAKLLTVLAHRAARGGYLIVSSMPVRAYHKGSDIDLYLDALGDEEGFVRLKLDSLELKDVLRLCESMLGSTDNMADVAGFLIARTGGNVGACVELLNTLAQEGRLNHRLGQWSVTSDGAGQTKKRGRRSAVRLNSVTTGLRTVLLTAAISGPRGPASIALRTTGLAQDEFAEQVLRLESMGILVWETVRNQAFLRFLDPTLPVRLIEKADRDLVAQLSGKATEVLLSCWSKGQPFDPVRLVEHLSRAGRPREALEVAITESERQESDGAYWLGIQLLTRALRISRSLLSPDVLRETELHVSIARMTRSRGDASAALDHCEKGLSLLRRAGLRGSDTKISTAVQLERQAGLCCEDLSEYDGAIDHYRQALSLLGPFCQNPEHKRRWMELQSLLGWTQMLARRYDESEKTTKELLKHVDAESFPEQAIQALNILGWICFYRAKPQEGLKYFRRGLSEAHGDSLSADAEFQSLTGAASASWLMGQWTDAVSYYQRALDLAERNRNPALKSKAIGNLAVAEYQLGKLRLAEKHFREFLALAIEGGLIETYVIALGNLGALLRDQGRNEQARELLEKARRIARKKHYDRHVLLIEGNIGELMLNKGEYKRSESLLRKVLQRVRKGGYADLVPEAYRRMACVALKQGSSRRFDYYARKCEECAQHVGDQLELCYLERLKAHCYILRNQYQKAEETFRNVASSFESSGASFEEALTKLQWAELCLKEGRVAQTEQLLSGLESVFDEAGATRHLDRVRSLRQELSQRITCSDEIAHVLKAFKKLRASDDVETALRSVAQTMVLTTGADRGLVIGLNRRGMIQFEASANFAGALEQDLNVSSRILEYVAKSREPLLIESAMTDPRFLDSSSIRSLQLGSVICVPVFAGDNVQAVLYADGKKSHLFREHRDFSLMQLVSHHVGLFLDNLRIRSENQLVEELITCLAHEMRSLLSAVLCSLKMMTMPSKQPLSYHVGSANEQVRRLSRLADETIDLIRCKSRFRDLGSERIDMNALIRHTVKALELIVHERRLSLDLELWDGLPAVKGQTEALEQVVANLVTNACKYTSSGGAIRIKSRLRSSVRDQSTSGSSYLYLSDDRNWKGSFVAISVINDGEGMDEAECERVFQKFARARKVESERRVSGSGLGLYICRKIVEQHGGRIWATPQKGKGTDITFTLPIASPPEVA